MDKNEIKTIRDEVCKAMNEIMNKYGFTESSSGVTYDPNGTKITFKVDFETTNFELLENKKKKEFELYGAMYGFTNADYNSLIVDKNKQFRFIGINPKASKNVCILREESTGKEFVAPVDYVKFYKK